jgi:hypothetical protein
MDGKAAIYSVSELAFAYILGGCVLRERTSMLAAVSTLMSHIDRLPGHCEREGRAIGRSGETGCRARAGQAIAPLHYYITTLHYYYHCTTTLHNKCNGPRVPVNHNQPLSSPPHLLSLPLSGHSRRKP